MTHAKSPISGPIWCAAQIKRNAFRQAEAALTRQGFPVFCPKIGRAIRRFGKQRPEMAALFPGYLFVALDLHADGWQSASHTPGVSRLITRANGLPAPVPQALIDGLQARCDADGLVRPPDAVSPGDKVRIASGAFADLVGTVERIAESRRVWVLLELLNAPRAVQLSIDMLQGPAAA